MKANTVVYRHRRLDTNEIFYVGIGLPKRPYNKINRSNHWKNIVNKIGNYDVEILAKNLTLEEAKELEILLILEYGRRDLGLGNLVNLTDGGEGSVGMIHSDETKHKIRESNKGRAASEESKKKMSEAKVGTKLTEVTKDRMRIAKRESNYIQSEETKLKRAKAVSGGKSGLAKGVLNTQTGIFYDTILEASKTTNLTSFTLSSHIKSGKVNFIFV